MKIAGLVGPSGSADDNDQVLILQRADGHDAFMLMSTAGAMDVFVSLDGTNFSTAALSLIDFGAEDNDPVLVTVAGRIYGFRGIFRAVRVLQNGGTAVENASLAYGSLN